MRSSNPPFTTRRAFFGFRFEGVTLEKGENYTSFQISWSDNRKEEIIKGEREKPIIFILQMN